MLADLLVAVDLLLLVAPLVVEDLLPLFLLLLVQLPGQC